MNDLNKPDDGIKILTDILFELITSSPQSPSSILATRKEEMMVDMEKCIDGCMVDPERPSLSYIKDGKLVPHHRVEVALDIVGLLDSHRVPTKTRSKILMIAVTVEDYVKHLIKAQKEGAN